MSRRSTVCCTVSLVGCLLVHIANLRRADRCMCALRNCRLHAWWKFKFEATIFISFAIVPLLFFVGFVNTFIYCFIWYCILFVLLILPQDRNNRSSAAQTIDDGVCASPRITRSYNSPVGKVPEGSVVNNKHLDLTINHLFCCILLVSFLHKSIPISILFCSLA